MSVPHHLSSNVHHAVLQFSSPHTVECTPQNTCAVIGGQNHSQLVTSGSLCAHRSLLDCLIMSCFIGDGSFKHIWQA